MKPAVSYSLSVFFPAHNEIDSLPGIVASAMETCPKLASEFEIIIVDDGSTDGTAELADRLAEQYPDVVRVMHHARNRGYGGALKTGFLSARNDVVFYTDADAQFDLGELPRVFPLICDADVVTCYREDRCDPWHRSLNTWLFEKAVYLVFGLKIRDPDCAFKLYRRDVIQRMNLMSEGAMIDVEMLLQAKRAGFRLVQAGVRHYPRKSGTPSGANPKVIFRAISEMWRLWHRIGSRFNFRGVTPAAGNAERGSAEQNDKRQIENHDG
ncbi:MAG TPA: glycosyltransferase family 2 protein [bacterium]|nr:glycosyltransferase family 2 protein [bacterium]